MGGLDTKTGLCVHDFWRDKIGLHINTKELSAAMDTVRSLAKKGETVLLSVDNTVAYHYLTKSGGRISHLNALMRPFLSWCMEHNINLKVNLVPSKDNQADTLSRLTDKGDYALKMDL